MDEDDELRDENLILVVAQFCDCTYKNVPTMLRQLHEQGLISDADVGANTNGILTPREVLDMSITCRQCGGKVQTDWRMPEPEELANKKLANE